MWKMQCENTKSLKNYMLEGLYKDVNRNVAFKGLTLIFSTEKKSSNNAICKP
jgi:hypothetical protein